MVKALAFILFMGVSALSRMVLLCSHGLCPQSDRVDPSSDSSVFLAGLRLLVNGGMFLDAIFQDDYRELQYVLFAASMGVGCLVNFCLMVNQRANETSCGASDTDRVRLLRVLTLENFQHVYYVTSFLLNVGYFSMRAPMPKSVLDVVGRYWNVADGLDAFAALAVLASIFLGDIRCLPGCQSGRGDRSADDSGLAEDLMDASHNPISTA